MCDMCYMASSIGILNCIQPAAVLLFSPVRFAVLVVWVYMCLYSITRIESGLLVPRKYKSTANLFALVTGPLVLLVFFVIDITKTLLGNEAVSKVSFRQALIDTFGKIKTASHSKVDVIDSIELMDSSGKSFYEVYGQRSDAQKTNIDVLTLSKGIILDCLNKRASDVLLDPKSNSIYEVRFRIDGFLKTISRIDGEKAIAMANSIKVISGMDIAEKRRPQDGAFMARITQGDVYFRVTSAGVLGGEKMSIRVLNPNIGLLNLAKIGLTDQSYETIADAVEQESGMIVLCGPTGSGKTTSLYAMLNAIDSQKRNVVTVENPIEYVLKDISQIEVNVRADITFANALRSILRQDPDVICVGEIRDNETASMALQSSQTGHLVLTTLHANSNMAALVRLVDFNIRPLLIASGLSMIISQRLVRKLCNHCKSRAELNPEQLANLKQQSIDPSVVMQANGCKRCYETGYYGRTGVFDVMRLDDKIKTDLLNNKLSMGDLKKQGDEKGKSNLKKMGMKKVTAGITTLEEIKRIVSRI